MEHLLLKQLLKDTACIGDLDKLNLVRVVLGLSQF